MRRIVIDNVAIPNDTEPKRQRNVNADWVGLMKLCEVDYDHIGSAIVTDGTAIKIETTPDGQEVYEGNVEIGDTVYWGIKKA